MPGFHTVVVNRVSGACGFTVNTVAGRRGYFMKAEKRERVAAIVLAAGSGRRVGSNIKKQYMQIGEREVIYYSLKAFENSLVDEVVLVVSPGDVHYCQKEIVDKYGFAKVSHIVEGGRERYHSVTIGLSQISDCDYIFIHDGARPLVSEEIIERAFSCVRKHKACVVGMPVKDTIKIADEEGNIASTPNRNLTWLVQTPQTFEFSLIKKAYSSLMEKEEELKNAGLVITDDAMVVETMTGHKVRLIEGSYENIKITTPEDIITAENFLKLRKV